MQDDAKVNPKSPCPPVSLDRHSTLDHSRPSRANWRITLRTILSTFAAHKNNTGDCHWVESVQNISICRSSFVIYIPESLYIRQWSLYTSTNKQGVYRSRLHDIDIHILYVFDFLIYRPNGSHPIFGASCIDVKAMCHTFLACLSCSAGSAIEAISLALHSGASVWHIALR